MLASSLIALLPLAALGDPAPMAASDFPLVPPPARPTFPQGTVIQRKPRFFISLGAQYIDSEVESPTGNDPEDDPGWSVDIGYVTWKEDLGLAVEAGLIFSSYTIDTSVISSESVDARRYLLGLRLVDDSADSRFLWHARGGLAWRQDDGESVIDDDGWGWYLGGGAEWKLGKVFSLGPQLLYMKTGSVNSSEWMLGLLGTLRF